MSPQDESRLGCLSLDVIFSDTVRRMRNTGCIRRTALNSAVSCLTVLQKAQSLKLYCSTKEQRRSVRTCVCFICLNMFTVCALLLPTRFPSVFVVILLYTNIPMIPFNLLFHVPEPLCLYSHGRVWWKQDLMAYFWWCLTESVLPLIVNALKRFCYMILSQHLMYIGSRDTNVKLNLTHTQPDWDFYTRQKNPWNISSLSLSL